MADDNYTPNYPEKTCKQLRALLKQRGVAHQHLKLKNQLTTAARDSDVRLQEAEQERARKREEDIEFEHQSLLKTVQERGMKVTGFSRKDMRKAVRKDDKKRERQRKAAEHKVRSAEIKEWTDTTYYELFQRDFRADPTRSSLMDLPSEVRVTVYKYLFEQPEITEDGMKIDYNPVFNRFENRRQSAKEARVTFWSLAAYSLQPSSIFKKEEEPWLFCDPYYMAIVERFLHGLGTDGRFGVKTIEAQNFTGCPKCGILPQDFTFPGYLTFKNTCDMLADCTNLATLRLTINEHYLFRNDQLTLEDFYLRGQELKTDGLTSFQNVLQALPNLRDADIEISGHTSTAERLDRLDWDELTSFLHWAFTDERRNKLWAAAKTILEATKLPQEHGRVHVNFTGGQTYGREWAYEEWLALMELESEDDEDTAD